MADQTILCIDLGTQCGWALHHVGGRIDSGSASFHPKSGEGPGAKFVRFRRFLNDQLQAAGGEINAVYWEHVCRHVSNDSAHAYGGFLAILLGWCEIANIRYQGNGLGVGTIKKHATGNGAAKKEEMIAWAKSAGFHPKDDNHADALAILRLALDRESGKVRLTGALAKRPDATVKRKPAKRQMQGALL